MKVFVKKLPKSQIELRIEVPFEEFEGFVEKTVQELGRDLEVQGFRKGKAPREVVEKKIGQERILKEAAGLAIRESYSKAILEQKIEAISSPQIEILSARNALYSDAGGPARNASPARQADASHAGWHSDAGGKLAPQGLVFKARTWVLPEIDLPDYKKIASQVKKREVRVTKEEIERLRKEKVRWERERLRGEILEKIAERTKIEIPEILITKEQERMLENLKRGVSQTLQISFEDYLTKLKKTEKELLDSFLPEAEKRVKIPLILREIGRKENVSATSQEIEEEIKKISKEESALKDLDQEQLKDYTREVLKNEKTFQLLESFIQK